MYQFELPDIGEGVVEAEVIEWKVGEGDALAVDQVFVELMTDKATIEIPSPRAGRVHRLCFKEGDIVPVGAILIEIDEGAQGTAAPPAPAPETATPETAAPEAPAAPVPERPAAEPAADASAHPPVMPARPTAHHQAGDGSDGAARAVPAVRELARRLGVDLEQVRGTGPGGRVMRRDVEAFAAGPPEPPRADAQSRDTSPPPEPAADATTAPTREAAEHDPADWQRIPLRGLRRTIARRMIESRRRAAHFTYVEELDVTALLAARERAIEESNAPEISPLAFIARAVVRALPDFPMLNASLDDEHEDIIQKRSVHLGIAVAADDALVVPVISDAGRLSTIGIAHEIARLADRARGNALRPEELRGSTFTISSLGRLGGIVSTPILNQPESAILGVNAIRELPRYVEGELQPRSIMNLSISVDHRIADGLMAARFIEALKTILEAADFPDLLSP